MTDEQPEPFVLFAANTRRARVFTIGPEHLDWLCVFCGKTGGLDGDVLTRAALAVEQINVVKAIEQGTIDELITSVGWGMAKICCRRSALEHVQQHVRFEPIEREDR